GKKIKAEMDAQRSRFLEGAERQHGIAKALANTIFDACAKFAEYGFNKSHSAPYAFITYQTAYLKTHFFQEFTAASMTYVMANTDKLSEFREDAKKHGIEVLPPSVNTSDAVFTARNGKIFYAIGAIKGVGQAVAEHIVEARGDKPFRDLADFATRVDPRIINKRTLETLVNAGAFDCLVPKREQAFAAIDMIIATAHRTNENAADGIMDMFASSEPEPIRLIQNFEPWGLVEKLDRERAAIGFHVSAHPLDQHTGLFKSMGIWTYQQLEAEVRDRGGSARKLAGTVTSRTDRRTRKGTPMMVVKLSDQTGSYEVIGFSEEVQAFGAILQVGANVVIGVAADERDDGISIKIQSAQLLDEAAQKVGKSLEIEAEDARCLEAIHKQLKPGGNGRIKFVVAREQGRRLYEIDIGSGWQINPALAGAIKSFDGVVDVRLN
ncbi:MAG TPA: OB-fold nucleic acid binding domain-containing protein, partial [Devosia sp.]|nr:OB-fold nucleic acid binding domain-containing protein [Devosia sp.]